MLQGNLGSFCDSNTEVWRQDENCKKTYARSLTLLFYTGMIQCLSIKMVMRLKVVLGTPFANLACLRKRKVCSQDFSSSFLM